MKDNQQIHFNFELVNSNSGHYKIKQLPPNLFLQQNVPELITIHLKSKNNPGNILRLFSFLINYNCTAHGKITDVYGLLTFDGVVDQWQYCA